MVLAAAAWKAGPVTEAAPVAASQPNIEAVGAALYGRYLFPFELAGLILLVAMIGAIVLTHRSRGDVRGQTVSKQIQRRPEEAVQNKQPGVGEGIEL
jgi:NADH-quinone oxidoreductase subunit J